MAHVEKQVQNRRGGEPGPVRWRVRYVSPDGRERNKSFLRKVDAERFAASVETDKARGEWIDPRLGKTLVEDWAKRWMAQLVHVRPKTLLGYESLLKTCVLPTFGALTLANVEQPAVAAWVASLRARGLSASRIRQAYRVLSGLMADSSAGRVSRQVAVRRDQAASYGKA